MYLVLCRYAFVSCPLKCITFQFFFSGSLELQLQGNPLECDDRFFWIKEAEQAGWITWAKNRGDSVIPECKNSSSENWKNATPNILHSGKSNKWWFVFKSERMVL